MKSCGRISGDFQTNCVELNYSADSGTETITRKKAIDILGKKMFVLLCVSGFVLQEVFDEIQIKIHTYFCMTNTLT